MLIISSQRTTEITLQRREQAYSTEKLQPYANAFHDKIVFCQPIRITVIGNYVENFVSNPEIFYRKSLKIGGILNDRMFATDSHNFHRYN